MIPPQKIKPIKVSTDVQQAHILIYPSRVLLGAESPRGKPSGQECEVVYPLRKPGPCLRALSQYSKLLYLQAQVPPHSKFGCLVKK